MRFYLLDRVTECEPGKRAAGLKAVSLSEDYLEHHFAGVPVMPGSLILEGLAQLAGYLCARTSMPEAPHKHKAVLSVVEKAKFYHPVRPGDTLNMEANLVSIHADSAMVDCTATVADQRVATARLIFSFHTLENEILEANRREVFSIWTTGKSE